MSIPKRRGRRHKDQISVLVSGSFKPSFQSRNKEFPAPSGTPNKLASSLNPKPSLAPSQFLKYTKDDL